MIPRSLALTTYLLFAACLLLSPESAFSQTKQIRLRNEIIATPMPAAAAVSAPAAAPKSGLFLLQFNDHPQPAQQLELRSLGVELLRYVPDDAFVARFDRVSPATIAALGYIRWIGPFRPEHKIHPALAAAASASPLSAAPLSVSLLVSPLASAAELAQVRGLLSSVVHESHLKQGTILRATLNPASLNTLAQSDAVLWIERAAKRHLVDEAASKIVGGDDGAFGTPTETQQLGFAGAGVTVAVADTGLGSGNAATMHPDLAGRVTTFLHYGNNITNAADEHSHGTHVAGIIAGNAATGETDEAGQLYGLGVASQASLVVQRIFDAAGNEAEPFPADETLTHDAVRAGAKIGSNSWGTDVQGGYDLDAAAFDELVRDADAVTPGDQPYILEFSAGNAGPDAQTLDSPAVGKNVIATGASENGGQLDFGIYDDGPETMADFSSRGPAEDGRIKPDLVAPGTFVASLLSSDATSQFAWLPIDNYYIYMGGTSQAGPHASGAAAVFVQYYQSQHLNATPSPALVKAALINSAVEMDQSNGGPGFIPNNDEGWGRIALTNIIGSPRVFEYLDQTVLLTSGQVYERHSFVKDSNQPLKITLAYTDVAGFPGAIPALVNDLDLVVVGPDGTLYRGNQFNGGESIPNAASPDNLNNVEAVHLNHPLPGDYLVRVRASNVVQDSRLDTQAIDQDFALVVSGDLIPAGSGLVVLDRTAYTAPGLVNLQVLDAAKSASNTVTVLLKSSTEPAGENYLLHAVGNYGSFTGAVATVLGNAAVDGKLEIHNGDAIEADYTDASSTLRTATAVADLQPPALTGVTASLDLGVITITWNTSEPCDSIVRYSTNFAFTLAVTNTTLTTSHSVKLHNLVPGQTYHFFVRSSDAAGNTTSDFNNGAFYSFVAVATPTVLMVDAYEPDDSSTTIDDSVYTNALAATGLGYSFWKVTDRGSPQLADLQPFPVVIWRVTDSIYYEGTNNTLSPGQQFMIQSYLNGGGSFFLSSMNILTALGDVPFRRDVLQVGGFIQNSNPYFPCTDCDEQFGVPAIQGADGNPTTAGVNVALDYSQYPTIDIDADTSLGPDFSSTFTARTNSTPILFEPSSGKTVGVAYPPPGQDSPGRVVFLSFPLDTVPASGAPPNNETALLKNILNFLVPGANGVGRIALDSPSYTRPSQVTVEVGDTDLAGTGHAQVNFMSTTAPAPVTITLNETPHAGLFRGFITLVATNPPAGAAQLLVHNGDTLTAAYFDASASANVLATAIVDTTPPAISNIVVTPGYVDATVTWTTSEPADSLVQFGESKLLGRTAYNQILTTSHSVTLTGLLPNRHYFYQVISRDDAGNAATADNNGSLYSFQTLSASRPPWSDDLEQGARNWTVVPDPSGDGTTLWTLGTPASQLQSMAHSGTKAWGSDINGQPPPGLVAASYLFSPFIDLSGLSQATLNFWQCFDFTSSGSGGDGSILEEGELLISTNSTAALASLPQLADYSGDAAYDWTLADPVDLSPYVGMTVQLVWHYGSFSFGEPLSGWFVDDVSITGVGAGFSSFGTIVVSKNLAQGTFSLSGPISPSGSGLVTAYSNAPPGQYVIEFGDVAFYHTPPKQTNTLAASSSLLIQGNYTFDDVNHNGIPDAWEQYYFGSVSTNRTQFTDTDGDGMSDYAEFIAGTNPTNATSRLVFLPPLRLPGGAVEIQWPAIPGRAYQVLASGDLVNWTVVSDWVQATGSPMSYLPPAASGPQYYKVQVRP